MNTHDSLSDGARPAEEAGRVQPNPTAVERPRVADEREAALVAREMRTTAPETGIDDRIKDAEVILADAATRDELADERDAVADERERATSLDAFLHPDADHYDTVIKVLRAAALDRSEAKSDRSSAANDRSKLGHG